MAAKQGGDKPDAATRAGRGVTRLILNSLVILASFGVLGAWAVSGLYKLAPGEAAVILRLGAFDRINDVEGWAFHLPPPLESHVVVNTGQSRSQSFGARPTHSTPGTPADAEEAGIAQQIKRDAIQTADSNIVNVAYELQYKVGDAYAYRFSMADPGAILHDATEAAMRNVVGKRDIDAVLSQDRREIAEEAQQVLERMLLSYVTEVGQERAAFEVERINFEKPQAPEAVREAFADVVSAGQDEKRSTLEATGDAREILQRAQSEAAEIREQAEGLLTDLGRRQDSRIRILEDNATELRTRILEPFFTTRAEGTGLGLALVSTIARLHGGHLDLSQASGSLGGA